MYRIKIMKCKILFMIGLPFLAALTSCATLPITAASTTPLNDRAYADLGETEGSDRVWSLFGLWMFGRPDTDEAIRKALAKNGGEALINATLTQKRMWFLLFSIDTVTVEGKAVKFYVEEGIPANETGNE